MKFGKALSKVVLIMIIALSVLAVTGCKKRRKKVQLQKKKESKQDLFM